jgi:NAD(P)-dependent dehydrogenase (short-subunit alcohol dehydrogenase family)
MGNRLAGKVAVITGAAGGIGRGIAEIYATEGAAVMIGDIKDAEGEAVAQALRDAGAHAAYRRCDVTSEEDCAALMRAAVEDFGGLDILINNVGWFPRATLEETSSALWDQIINVNLRSAFFCCKHAVPLMRQRGGGSIINIGSPNSKIALPNLVAYGAAKGGLVNLTVTLAQALAKDRIRVNLISPGWVLTDTEIATQQREGRTDADMVALGQRLRLGRYQTPQDAAWACVYLGSDESTQVTGQFTSVDAGATTLGPALLPQ